MAVTCTSVPVVVLTHKPRALVSANSPKYAAIDKSRSSAAAFTLSPIAGLGSSLKAEVPSPMTIVVSKKDVITGIIAHLSHRGRPFPDWIHFFCGLFDGARLLSPLSIFFAWALRMARPRGFSSPNINPVADREASAASVSTARPSVLPAGSSFNSMDCNPKSFTPAIFQTDRKRAPSRGPPPSHVPATPGRAFPNLFLRKICHRRRPSGDAGPLRHFAFRVPGFGVPGSGPDGLYRESWEESSRSGSWRSVADRGGLAAVFPGPSSLCSLHLRP